MKHQQHCAVIGYICAYYNQPQRKIYKTIYAKALQVNQNGILKNIQKPQEGRKRGKNETQKEYIEYK